LLQHICKEAMEKKLCRVEWADLAWNKPSINSFAKTPVKVRGRFPTWPVYLLDSDRIKKVARQDIKGVELEEYIKQLVESHDVIKSFEKTTCESCTPIRNLLDNDGEKG